MKQEWQEQITIWTIRYLDGNLDGEEFEHLNKAIEECPEARTIFDEISRQAFAFSETKGQASSEVEPRVSRQTMWMPIAIAALGATALLMVFLVLSLPPHREELAKLVTHESAYQLLDGTGDFVRQLTGGSEVSLVAGQGVRLDSATAVAEIQFDDGTLVSIPGHAVVRVYRSEAEGKRVVVQSGQIEAEVTKQPKGKPMVIETPTSVIEVLGTRLEVNANDRETLLAVTSGRVTLTREADGARVEVVAGKQVRSTRSDSDPLVTQSMPPLSHNWEVTFNDGLPSGWLCGKWLSADGTVLAHPNLKNGYNFHSIASSNAWKEGHHSHFQIHSDSILYLKFRMGNPEPFFLMLNLRATPDSVRRQGGNVFYENKEWLQDLQPNQWRTLRIPLNQFDRFRRGELHSDEIDLTGLAAFKVYLTTEDRDLALEIDSIRVVREQESPK